MADRRTRVNTKTAATWTSQNVVLASGEIGYESDTGKLKIGDGTTAWATLGYIYARSDTSSATNFTSTLQVNGSDVTTDADIGTTIQPYNANLTDFTTACNLPTSDGSANQVLQTDGAGTISFATQSGGSLADQGVTASSAELNTLAGITATTEELNFMDGVTSNVQTQLDAKASTASVPADLSDLTDTGGLIPADLGDLTDTGGLIPADIGDLTDVGGLLGASSLSDLSVTASAAELNVLDGITATTEELNFMDGVTSNVQTQLDAKQAADANLSSFLSAIDLPTSDGTDGQVLTTDGSGNVAWEDVPSGGGGASSLSDLGVTASTAELNTLDGLTASTTELNTLDGLTASTVELNKLDGLTATTTQLNYVDGVTSNIQTQLDNKQALDANLTAFVGAVDFPTVDGNDEQVLFTNGLGQLYWGSISGGGGSTTLSDLGITATAAELNYVDGVTSNVQTQLDNIVATSGTFSLNLNQQGELAVVTGTARWYAPFDLSVSAIKSFLSVAADANVTFNILKNGSTAKSGSITAGQLSSTVGSPTFTMSEGDYITVDTTAVGSSSKGEDLVIQLKYTQD